MDLRYPNPALEAELAWRHELIRKSARRGSRRGAWFGSHRRTR
jgi:hypothetical protein